MRAGRIAAIAALIGAAVAAGAWWALRAGPEVVRTDLLGRLRAEQTTVWTADLLVGAVVGEGFGPVVLDTGLPSRWVTGASAALSVPRLRGRGAVEVRIDASDGAPGQRVRLRVNGTELDGVPVPSARGTIGWTVPRRLLERGRNDLLLVTHDGAGFRVHAVAVVRGGDGWTLGDGLDLDPGGVARVGVQCRAACALRVIGLTGVLTVEVEPDPGDGASARVTVPAAGVVPLPIPEGGAAFLSVSTAAGAHVDALELEDAPAPTAPPHVATDRGRPDIVVYVMDTTRADRFSVLGYDVPTTPRLQRFVDEGAVAAPLAAVAPWTRPSVATMFTGLGYDAHGVHDYGAGLPEGAPYVPAALSAAGYVTRAFVTNGHIARSTGFARGFDHFDGDVGRREAGAFWEHKRRIEDVMPTVVADLAAQPTDRPLFLYVHSMGPHDPYQPPDDAKAALGVPADLPRIDADPLDRSAGQVEYVRQVGMGQRPLEPDVAAALSKLYDAEIRAEDAHFEALFAALQARGRWDDTLVVVVADHGEAFGEHGRLGHERDLHAELLQVPLVVKWPAGWAVPALDRATALDLAPTLLDAAGLPPFDTSVGRSLLAGGSRGAPHASATLLRQVALHDGRYKLITDRLGTWSRLYDVSADPGEQTDLAGARPARVAAMRGALLERLAADRALATRWGYARGELDDGEIEALRALGYVE